MFSYSLFLGTVPDNVLVLLVPRHCTWWCSRTPCPPVLYLMMFSYSLSPPLESLKRRYMTEASTLAGEYVLGSLRREITESSTVRTFWGEGKLLTGGYVVSQWVTGLRNYTIIFKRLIYNFKLQARNQNLTNSSKRALQQQQARVTAATSARYGSSRERVWQSPVSGSTARRAARRSGDRLLEGAVWRCTGHRSRRRLGATPWSRNARWAASTDSRWGTSCEPGTHNEKYYYYCYIYIAGWIRSWQRARRSKRCKYKELLLPLYKRGPRQSLVGTKALKKTNVRDHLVWINTIGRLIAKLPVIKTNPPRNIRDHLLWTIEKRFHACGVYSASHTEYLSHENRKCWTRGRSR